MLAILTILSVEVVALHFLPYLSALILYITTTALVFFAFYVTPWLVFKSIEVEQHYLKSMKESHYLKRLSVI